MPTIVEQINNTILTGKVGTRGRKAIEISATDLQTALADLEKTQPDGKFPNRSHLWTSLEATAWAKSRSPRPLTAQVAMSLAKKFNTQVQTPVGIKGRVKGQGPVKQGKRGRKNIDSIVMTDLRNGIPKDTLVKFDKTVNKAAKGSLKAVIKLKCLDCCAWQQKEVSLCTVTNCPSWNFRPYKHKETLTVDGRSRINLGMLGESDDESEGTD